MQSQTELRQTITNTIIDALLGPTTTMLRASTPP